MPLDVARVVQHEAVFLAFADSQSAPNNLLEKRDRLRGTKDADHVDVWRIEASGKDVHVDNVFEAACLEISEDFRPLFLWCIACHKSAIVSVERLHNLARMFDRRCEEHHAVALRGGIHDLPHNSRGQSLLPTERSLYAVCCVFAHGINDQARRVIHLLRDLAHGRCQVSTVDQHSCRYGVDPACEVRLAGVLFAVRFARLIRLVDVARPQSVRGRGQSNHAEMRVLRSHMVDDVPECWRDPVGLIDDHRAVVCPERFERILDGLRRAEHDGVSDRLLAHRCGEERRGPPNAFHVLLMVLHDQFGGRRNHKDALAFADLEQLVTDGRDDVALARARGSFHDARGSGFADPLHHGVYGVLLVVAEGHLCISLSYSSKNAASCGSTSSHHVSS